MGSPLKSVFKKEPRDDISNRSANPVFSEVAEVFLSRRRFLQMGAVAGAAVSFPYLITPENVYRICARYPIYSAFIGQTNKGREKYKKVTIPT